MDGPANVRRICGAVGAAALVLAGCAASGDGSAPRAVSLSEFARPVSAAAAGPASNEERALAEGAGEGDDAELAALLAALQDPAIPASIRPGERFVVDSLVGEVNGRPVYADEFLTSLEDRLLAVHRQFADDPRELRARFRLIIAGTLNQVIENELILAEAESSLTEEQQMGLFAFLRSFQQETIRKVGAGARSQTERYYQEQGEGGLEDRVELEKNRVIIGELYRRKILPRVIVSWRDIEREYERRYGEFNPPRTVTLARIRLRSGAQSQQIAIVTERLAAGDAFAAIATDLGMPDGGVWATFDVPEEGLAGIELAAELKAALVGLEEGRTTAPIEIGGYTVWLQIVEFRDEEQRSIYDPEVQRALTAMITSERRQEEWNRYLASLMAKGVYDELDIMAERLYHIAIARYAPDLAH